MLLLALSCLCVYEPLESAVLPLFNSSFDGVVEFLHGERRHCVLCLDRRCPRLRVRVPSSLKCRSVVPCFVVLVAAKFISHVCYEDFVMRLVLVRVVLLSPRKFLKMSVMIVFFRGF